MPEPIKYEYNSKANFLASVRKKYPVYSSWDDDKLYTSLIEKYPVYADQIKPEPVIEEKQSLFQSVKDKLFDGGLQAETPTEKKTLKKPKPKFSPSTEEVVKNAEEKSKNIKTDDPPILNHTTGTWLNKYAPPIDSSGQDNNTDNYLSVINQMTGADADTPLAEVHTDSLIQAVATQEGFYQSAQWNQENTGRETNLSQEWNNPGMLEFREQEGATPSPEIKNDKGEVLYPEGRFAVFPQNTDMGFQALKNQIEKDKGVVFANPDESGIDVSHKIARNNSLPDGHPIKRDAREILLEDKKRMQSLKDQKILNAEDPVQALKETNAVMTQIEKSGMSDQGKEEAKQKYISSPFGTDDDKKKFTAGNVKYDYSTSDFEKDIEGEQLRTDLDKSIEDFTKADTQTFVGKNAVDLTDPNTDPKLYEKRKKNADFTYKKGGDDYTFQGLGQSKDYLTFDGKRKERPLFDIKGRIHDLETQRREKAIDQYNTSIHERSVLGRKYQENLDKFKEFYDKLEKRERPTNVDPQVIEQLDERGAVIDGHYFYDMVNQKIVSDPELAEELNEPKQRFNERFARPWHLLKINAETHDIADEDQLTASDVITKPEDILKSFPFVEGGKMLYDAQKIGMIIHYLSQNVKVSDEDMLYLRDFNDRLQREVSLGNMTISGIAQLPAFIGEMWATGGIYTASKEGIKIGMEKSLKWFFKEKGQKILNTKLAEKGLLWGSRIGGVAVQSSVARGVNVVAGTMDRYRDTYQVVEKFDKDRQKVLTAEFVKEGETLGKSVYKSWMDNFIEFVSEKSGASITKLGNKAKSKLFNDAIEMSVKKANPQLPPGKVTEILKQSYIGGFGEEWSEERLGQVLRHLAGVEELKMPTGKEFASELMVLGIPQIARAGASKFDQSDKKRAKLLEDNLVEMYNQYIDIENFGFDQEQGKIDVFNDRLNIAITNNDRDALYDVLDDVAKHQTSLPTKTNSRSVGKGKNKTWIVTISDQYGNEMHSRQFGTVEEANEYQNSANTEIQAIQEEHRQEAEDRVAELKEEYADTGWNPFTRTESTESDQEIVLDDVVEVEETKPIKLSGEGQKAINDLQERIREIDKLLKVADPEDVKELTGMREKVVDDLNRLQDTAPKVAEPKKLIKISPEEKIPIKETKKIPEWDMPDEEFKSLKKQDKIDVTVEGLSDILGHSYSKWHMDNLDRLYEENEKNHGYKHSFVHTSEVADWIAKNSDPNDKNSRDAYNILIRQDKWMDDGRMFINGKMTVTTSPDDLKMYSLDKVKEIHKKREEAHAKIKALHDESNKKKDILKAGRSEKLDLKGDELSDEERKELERIGDSKNEDDLRKYFDTYETVGVRKDVTDNRNMILDNYDADLIPSLGTRLEQIEKEKDDTKGEEKGGEFVPYHKSLQDKIKFYATLLAKDIYNNKKGVKNFTDERVEKSYNKLKDLLDGDINAPRQLLGGKVEEEVTPVDVKEGKFTLWENGAIDSGEAEVRKGELVWVENDEVVDNGRRTGKYINVSGEVSYLEPEKYLQYIIQKEPLYDVIERLGTVDGLDITIDNLDIILADHWHTVEDLKLWFKEKDIKIKATTTKKDMIQLIKDHYIEVTPEEVETERKKWTTKRIKDYLSRDNTAMMGSLAGDLLDADVPAKLFKATAKELGITLDPNMPKTAWEYANAIEKYYKNKRKSEEEVTPENVDDERVKKEILKISSKQIREKFPPIKTTIDWGDKRGQGKRSGGMVKGAMSDVSLRGEKTYTDLLGGVKEIQDDPNDLIILSNDNIKFRYLKARTYGFDHVSATNFAIDDILPFYSGFEEVTPEVPTQPINLGTSDVKIYNVKLTDLNTDLNLFQNRLKEFSEDKVKDIVDDFDERRLDPIDVWTNPENGKTYIIEGHSRAEALRRLKIDKANVRYFEGTREEAIAYAETKNDSKATHSLLEKAQILQKRIERKSLNKGKTIAEAKKMYGKDANTIIALSRLNPNGKAVQTITAFSGTDELSHQDVITMAKWIGEVRNKYPEMTDSHENEMFDLLYDNFRKKEAFKSSIGFTSFIDQAVSRRSFMGKFDTQKPLNLKNLRSLTPTEVQYDEDVKKAEKKLQQAKKKLDKVRAKAIEKGVGTSGSGFDLDKYIKPESDDVAFYEKELLELKQSKGLVQKQSKKEVGLFDQLDNVKDELNSEGESNEEIIKTQEDSDTTPSGQIEDVEEEVETDKKSKKKFKAKTELKSEKKEAIKDIQDFGKKIGGARKDIWKDRNFNKDDLKDMNDREVIKFARKEAIFPVPDYKKLVDTIEGVGKVAEKSTREVRYHHITGRPIEEKDNSLDVDTQKRLVVYYIKVIRDSMPQPKPTWSRERIETYVDAVTYVRNKLMDVKNISDIITLKERLFPAQDRKVMADGKYSQNEMNDMYWILGDRFRKVRNQLGDTWSISTYLQKIEKTGFPEMKPKYMQDVAPRFDVSKREWFVGSGHWILSDAPFKTKEEAEKWINDVYEPEMKKKEKEKKKKRKRIDIEKRRPITSNLKRTGKDHRNGKNISADDFLKTFGFSGGEFGNWLTNEDRQASLNMAYDSFMDLASILNIPPKSISLNGELSIGFGSRGRGGKGSAVAHYEPARMVINLTKFGGAGALAHEWGHAVDDYFGRLSNDRRPDKPYMSHGKSGQEFKKRAFKESNLRPEMYDEWLKLSKAIQDKLMSEEEIISGLEAQINKTTSANLTWVDSLFSEHKGSTVKGIEPHPKYDAYRKRIINHEIDLVEVKIGKMKPVMMYDGLLELYDELYQKRGYDFKRGIKGLSGNLKYFKPRLDTLKKYKEGIFENPDGTRYKPMGRTEYMKESLKLDNSKTISRSNYWATHHEMFARAFESFVYDKIKENEDHSPYLVTSSVLNKNWATVLDNNGKEIGVKPYPEGEERVNINNAFESFWDVVQYRTDVDGKEPLFQLSLNHGSPHSFEKFSVENLGSGSGSQVFGWGLYFTDTEGIARHYASLTDSTPEFYHTQIGNLVLRQGKTIQGRQQSSVIDYSPHVLENAIKNGSLDLSPFVRGTNLSDGMTLNDIKVLSSVIEDLFIYEDKLRPLSYLKGKNEIEIFKEVINDIGLGYNESMLRQMEERLPENEEILRVLISSGKTPSRSGINQDYIDSAKEDMQEFRDKIRMYKLLISEVEKGNFTISEMENDANRNLYRVSLHKGKTPDQYDYLHWNHELKQRQYSKIKDALSIIDPKLEEWVFMDGDYYVANGRDLYNRIKKYPDLDKLIDGGKNKRTDYMASMILLKSGIDGIKYPTGGLGASPSKLHLNYVVFDENAITIEEHIKFQRSIFKDAKKQTEENIKGKLKKTMSYAGITKDIATRAISQLEKDLNEYSGFGVEEGSFQLKSPESSPETKATFELARIFGQQIIFIDTGDLSSDKQFNAVTHRGKIFVSTRHSKNHSPFFAVGHELTHRLEQESPELFDKLWDVVLEETEDISGVLKQYATNYGNPTQNEDMLFREFIGDVMGDAMQERTFWTRVYAKSPELFKKILDLLKNIIKQLRFNKKYKTRQYLKDFDRVVEVASDIMVTYAETKKQFGNRIPIDMFYPKSKKSTTQAERIQFQKRSPEKDRPETINNLAKIYFELGTKTSEMKRGDKEYTVEKKPSKSDFIAHLKQMKNEDGSPVFSKKQIMRASKEFMAIKNYGAIAEETVDSEGVVSPSLTALEKKLEKLDEKVEEKDSIIDDKWGVPKEEKDKAREQRKTIKTKIDSIISGHALGQRDKKSDLKVIKKMIRDYAKETLPNRDIWKSEYQPFLTIVANAENLKDVQEAMLKIDAITDRVYKRAYRRGIRKLFKKGKLFKDNKGRVRGTMTADIQARVDEIKEIYTTNELEINDEIFQQQALVDKLENDPSTDEDVLDKAKERLSLLELFGNFDKKDLQDMVIAYANLEAIIKDGKSIRQEKNKIRRIQRDIRNQLSQGVITGDSKKPVFGRQERRSFPEFDDTKFRNKMKNMWKGASASIQGWDTLLDMLSYNDKSSGAFESFLNTEFGKILREADLKEQQGLREKEEALTNNAHRIYGLKRGIKFVKGKLYTTKKGILEARLIENENQVEQDVDIPNPLVKAELDKLENLYDQELITVAEFKKKEEEILKDNEKTVKIVASQNELAQYWMWYQDESLRPTFDTMGWTEETISQIEKALDPQVKEFAEYLLYEFYPSYYPEINEVYRKMFHVNMNRNPKYSHVSREVFGDEFDLGETLTSKGAFGSAYSPHLIARVNSKLSFSPTSMLDNVYNHIFQMEHFISHAEAIRDIRGTFSNETIRKAIEQYHGKYLLGKLDNLVDRVARGGVDPLLIVKWVDSLISNFVKAKIGVKPIIWLKQQASIPANLAEIPVLHMIKGLGEYAFNRKKARKLLMENSELLKSRGRGYSRDVRAVLKRSKAKRLADNPGMVDMMMFPAKSGDATAIRVGGYPVYIYHYRKKLKELGEETEENRVIAHLKGIEEFEIVSPRWQQSGVQKNLSYIQASGSFLKLLTMFLNSPIQYLQQGQTGIRNLIAGRGKKRENIKRTVVAYGVLQATFNFISSAFEPPEDDEDWIDYWKELSISWSRGIPLVGSIAEYVMFRRWQFQITPIESMIPEIGKAFDASGNFIKALAGKAEFTKNEFMDMADDVSKIIGSFTGIAYEGVTRSLKGIHEVSHGVAKKKLRKVLGYSDSQIYGSRDKKIKYWLKDALEDDSKVLSEDGLPVEFDEWFTKLLDYEGKTEKQKEVGKKKYKKVYRIRSNFGYDNKYVNRLMKPGLTNDEKLSILIEMNDDLGKNDFDQFMDNAKKKSTGRLISPELRRKYKNRNR